MKTTMLKKLIVSEGTYTCKGCAPGRNLSLDPTFKRACGNLGTFAKCSSQVNTVSGLTAGKWLFSSNYSDTFAVRHVFAFLVFRQESAPQKSPVRDLSCDAEHPRCASPALPQPPRHLLPFPSLTISFTILYCFIYSVGQHICHIV